MVRSEKRERQRGLTSTGPMVCILERANIARGTLCCAVVATTGNTYIVTGTGYCLVLSMV